MGLNPNLNGIIDYIPNFFRGNPDDLFRDLKKIDWVRRDTTPRMEYYTTFNMDPIPYTYGSGDFARTYEPQPMVDPIWGILGDLQVHFQTKFEMCFLNRYLNQSDHLGWHSDNSPEMDDARPIVIVSFGVEREIWFRRIGSKDQVEKLLLGHGSVCIMAAGMQDTHQHRIPKCSKHCGERISLTFRGYTKP